MDTMSALDSGFLQLEDAHAALHIGSVGVFEGPMPSFAEIRDEIAAKVPRVPRYQQRMRRVPGDLGRPVWRDDPAFEVENHLHRVALPHPGGDGELQQVVGEIMSVPLEHDRPLWEDWVIEGLAEGRWALLTKVHHSMVDGIAGTDLLTTFFGPDPLPDQQAASDQPSDASDAPDGEADGSPLARGDSARQRLMLAVGSMRDTVVDSSTATLAALTALGHPRTLAGTVRDVTDGLLHFATALRPVSRSSLIGPLGSERSYRWTEVPLEQVLALRAAYGCTVNDVVLAAVTKGFEALLVHRGEAPTARAVRTLVPVSVRRPEQRGEVDNRVSAILLDLPVDQDDPAAVLAVIHDRMQRLKASHEDEAGEVVTSLGNLVPPPVLAAGLRLAFRFPQQFVTTVVTNVPGPREELRLVGRRMLAAYPYVPIADRLRIGIAVTSYDGKLLFGITADRDSTGDIDVLRDALVAAFGALAAQDVRTQGVPA